MVNRTNRNIARHIDRLNDKDTSVHAYQPNASAKHQLRDNLFNDDVIAALSNAYENRRARQVVEWERLYMRNVAA